ncbi:MAG: hypothetical protein QM627_04695 [Luteolibacter sp.]
MNDTNPYSSPQANPSINFSGSDQFRDLDFKQLKKLYHRSSNINVITFLLSIALIASAFASIMPDIGEEIPRVAFIGMTIFYALAVAGLFRRTSWGRILGIVVCIMSLLSIPIGTLIGAFGLFAFFGAPQLFGTDRVTHKELKSEFKLRKANLKKG